MFPFVKTLRSVTKANLLGLMFASAGLAVAVVLMTVGALTWLTAHLVNIQIGWLDSLINWLAGGILGVAGWFMLPAIIVLVAGMFQEKTIHRVERACYPDEVRSREPMFWPDFTYDIRFTLRALLLNVLVLPLYLIGIGFVVSVALNSYLVGREFFESAAGYHIGKPQAKTVGQQNKAAVYGGGLVITLMTLTPVINLFVPVFAIVWMVHVYHGLKKGRPAD
jgi:CysZ protein